MAPDIPDKPQTTSDLQNPEEPKPRAFDAWDPRITRQIDALIRLADAPGKGPDNTDLVREMIVTALKTQNSGLDRGDVKILSRALRELRYGFRIFKPYRNRRKVTIFGSARTPAADPDYKMARQFARRMAKEGFMVITGAGPGIMKAGNEGAGKGNSFGINIRLPFEQQANEFVARDSRFIDCRFFFTRKLMFLKETSAVAFFAGGFGTHDEALETLTLIQTGKCDPMPVVFVERPGGRYWSDWRRYVVHQLLNKGKISPEDMSLFKVTSSVEEAVREIMRFYRNYHSLRYVKDQLAIRLLRPVPRPALEMVRQKFKDIGAEGALLTTGALPQEEDHKELPRLVFRFNRVNFGRLRQLIDVLNAY